MVFREDACAPVIGSSPVTQSAGALEVLEYSAGSGSPVLLGAASFGSLVMGRSFFGLATIPDEAVAAGFRPGLGGYRLLRRAAVWARVHGCLSR